MARKPGAFSHIRAFDILILALAAVAFVASAVIIYGGPPASTLVISDGKDEWLYPLGENREIQVQGSLGESTIVIKDGQARFTHSPCHNQLCIGSAPVFANGDWAACLPNGILIRVEGAAVEDEGIDAVVK